MALSLRLTCLALLAASLMGCTSVFFYPMSDWVQNPARQGLEYEDTILIHPDGLRLHGWWLPSATEEVKGTVYFLHGNAQNVSTHLMNVHWLPEAGYQVFLLDYRGYGLSEGKPSLPEVFEDVQLGLDWLSGSERVEGPMIVFGQSLGASMLPYVLARDRNEGRYDCVIMEAAFAGFRDITRDVMRGSWVLWPFSFVFAPFISTDWDAEDHITGLAPASLLLLHSYEDQIIPYAHGERLRDAAPDSATFQRLRGGHIASLRDPAVRDRLLDFMQQECGVH